MKFRIILDYLGLPPDPTDSGYIFCSFKAAEKFLDKRNENGDRWDDVTEQSYLDGHGYFLFIEKFKNESN
jgi:hypothetical protein